MVYRFRVTLEDYDDVLREIDIRANQYFLDLHNTIQQCVGFDKSHDASFYISDDHWRKGPEIKLKAVESDGEDKAEAKLMNKSKLGAFIDDPHQKILYIFDFSAMWTFHIELIKILDNDNKTVYPKVSKSVGAAPKQYKVTTIPPLVIDEDEDDIPKEEVIFHSEEALDVGDADENSFIEETEEEELVSGEDLEEGDVPEGDTSDELEER